MPIGPRISRVLLAITVYVESLHPRKLNTVWMLIGMHAAISNVGI